MLEHRSGQRRKSTRTAYETCVTLNGGVGLDGQRQAKERRKLQLKRQKRRIHLVFLLSLTRVSSRSRNGSRDHATHIMELSHMERKGNFPVFHTTGPPVRIMFREHRLYVY